MDPFLLTLASDVLHRLEGSPLPGKRPQLLACRENTCLLRGPQGLESIPLAQLPEDLDLSPLIDHTLLRADARPEEIDALCEEAMTLGLASVCVNPFWVSRCASRLRGSVVRVCTVVGFPLGATTPHCKAEEAREAFLNGAHEIDMVLAVGLAKAGDWEGVRSDLKAVRDAVPDAVLKLILETCLLSDLQKIEVCKWAVEEGLDFVKTSTGFSTGGATAADVRLLRQTVGTGLGVKASGGIRTYEAALEMVQAGATRLGLSASRAVVQVRGGS